MTGSVFVSRPHNKCGVTMVKWGKIMTDIEQFTSDTIALLTKLVSFDSVSRNSNLPIIDYIEGYLKDHGAVCARAPSPDGKKSNLLARIGPEVAGGVVFSGHTDVVPIDGQDWASDPFTVIEKDEKLFGRGTSDMKCFIAICMALTPKLVAMALEKPVWFAFSYDEEVGCLGAPHLLDYMVKHVPLPAFAVIGEPTMMQVVTAHKGVVSFETTVHGLEWHSSQPHLGVNAIQISCELIHMLMGIAKELEDGDMRDERFNPPYSTVHVGTIHGGTARNIIPKECKFQWEIRPLPGENYEKLVDRFKKRCAELLAGMKKKFAGAEIINLPMSHMSGVTLQASANANCQTVMRCAQTNREVAVSFGTEAGVFNDHGIPAIICGPGNIEQAHKPNEFIELSQVRAGVEFMLRLTSDPSLFKK